MAYTSCCLDGQLTAHVRPGDGSGQASRLLSDEKRGLFEITYSPDGAWVVYTVGPLRSDLYGRRVGADSAPVPLVVTDAWEGSPAVSPDGRWLAYVSNETGHDEVYVCPFPNTKGGRWLASSNPSE